MVDHASRYATDANPSVRTCKFFRPRVTSVTENRENRQYSRCGDTVGSLLLEDTPCQ
jgi:hypothetical protein